MANFIRSAKSGSDWTLAELCAYNIRVEHQDAATFFGIPELPAPLVNPVFLTAEKADDVPQDDAHEDVFLLLRLLHEAMDPEFGLESAVDDFAIHLLEFLGYVKRPRMGRTRRDLPFLICGEMKHAQTDVCIVDGNNILLAIQENKRRSERSNPVPQLLSKVIATFCVNNVTRRRALCPPLDQATIPGIIMKGTFPTFYKISVTEALAHAVAHGTFPVEETVVHAYTPELPTDANQGMVPLDNRRIIVSCYEAFKRFL